MLSKFERDTTHPESDRETFDQKNSQMTGLDNRIPERNYPNYDEDVRKSYGVDEAVDFGRDEDARLLALLEIADLGSEYWGALAGLMTTGRMGVEVRQRAVELMRRGLTGAISDHQF